jgi:hypothetical protein
MKIQLTIFSLFVLCLFSSCNSKKEDLYVTEEEILQRLSVIDPSMRLMPDTPEVVGCKNYSGCKKFIRALFNNIEIFLVEMHSERIAKEYADEKNILHLGNWLFDNIQREPEIRKKLEQAIILDLSKVKPVEKKKESH